MNKAPWRSGSIEIVVRGTFRGRDTRRGVSTTGGVFEATSRGHAHAVAHAIAYLSGSVLPEAIALDFELQQHNTRGVTMIYYVKENFPDGSHQAGDELTAEQYAEIAGTPNAAFVLELPDDARARLDMRDATPNKPVGAAPDPEDATSGSVVADADAPPHVYVGGDEAIGTIENPSPQERALDAHPEANLGDAAP